MYRWRICLNNMKPFYSRTKLNIRSWIIDVHIIYYSVLQSVHLTALIEYFNCISIFLTLISYFQYRPSVTHAHHFPTQLGGRNPFWTAIYYTFSMEQQSITYSDQLQTFYHYSQCIIEFCRFHGHV